MKGSVVSVTLFIGFGVLEVGPCSPACHRLDDLHAIVSLKAGFGILRPVDETKVYRNGKRRFGPKNIQCLLDGGTFGEFMGYLIDGDAHGNQAAQAASL